MTKSVVVDPVSVQSVMVTFRGFEMQEIGTYLRNLDFSRAHSCVPYFTEYAGRDPRLTYRWDVPAGKLSVTIVTEMAKKIGNTNNENIQTVERNKVYTLTWPE